MIAAAELAQAAAELVERTTTAQGLPAAISDPERLRPAAQALLRHRHRAADHARRP